MKLLILDNRLQNKQTIIDSVLENVEVLLLDYENDTFETIHDKKKQESYDSVAIMQHSTEGNTFQFTQNNQFDLLDDDELITLGIFFMEFDSPIIDLLQCALMSRIEWKSALTTLESTTGLNFRASDDNTGNLKVGGNWVLESDNVNVKNIYFTEGIEGWEGVLTNTIVSNGTWEQKGAILTLPDDPDRQVLAGGTRYTTDGGLMVHESGWGTISSISNIIGDTSADKKIIRVVNCEHQNTHFNTDPRQRMPGTPQRELNKILMTIHDFTDGNNWEHFQTITVDFGTGSGGPDEVHRSKLFTKPFLSLDNKFLVCNAHGWQNYSGKAKFYKLDEGTNQYVEIAEVGGGNQSDYGSSGFNGPFWGLGVSITSSNNNYYFAAQQSWVQDGGSYGVKSQGSIMLWKIDKINFTVTQIIDMESGKFSNKYSDNSPSSIGARGLAISAKTKADNTDDVYITYNMSTDFAWAYNSETPTFQGDCEIRVRKWSESTGIDTEDIAVAKSGIVYEKFFDNAILDTVKNPWAKSFDNGGLLPTNYVNELDITIYGADNFTPTSSNVDHSNGQVIKFTSNAANYPQYELTILKSQWQINGQDGTTGIDSVIIDDKLYIVATLGQTELRRKNSADENWEYIFRGGIQLLTFDLTAGNPGNPNTYTDTNSLYNDNGKTYKLLEPLGSAIMGESANKLNEGNSWMWGMHHILYYESSNDTLYLNIFPGVATYDGASLTHYFNKTNNDWVRIGDAITGIPGAGPVDQSRYHSETGSLYTLVGESSEWWDSYDTVGSVRMYKYNPLLIDPNISVDDGGGGGGSPVPLKIVDASCVPALAQSEPFSVFSEVGTINIPFDGPFENNNMDNGFIFNDVSYNSNILAKSKNSVIFDTSLLKPKLPYETNIVLKIHKSAFKNSTTNEIDSTTLNDGDYFKLTYKTQDAPATEPALVTNFNSYGIDGSGTFPNMKNGQIYLTWDEVANTDYYKLEINNRTLNINIKTNGTLTQPFIFSRLKTGKDYTFKIVAVNNVNKNNFTFTTPVQTVKPRVIVTFANPTTPENFAVTAESSSLNFTWDASVVGNNQLPIRRYEIIRGDVTTKCRSRRRNNRKTIKGLTPSTTYSGYTIRAVDIKGNTSTASASIDGTTITLTDLEITTVTPSDNQTDVDKKSNITITYNQSLIRGTSNIELTDASGLEMTSTIDVSVVDDGGVNKYFFKNNGTTNNYSEQYYYFTNGTYTLQNIPSNHPIAFLNDGKTDKISYTGDNETTQDINGTSYNFYHGNVTLTVNGDFGVISIFCKNHGYMGGENKIIYGNITQNIEPSSKKKVNLEGSVATIRSNSILLRPSHLYNLTIPVDAFKRSSDNTGGLASTHNTSFSIKPGALKSSLSDWALPAANGEQRAERVEELLGDSTETLVEVTGTAAVEALGLDNVIENAENVVIKLSVGIESEETDFSEDLKTQLKEIAENDTSQTTSTDTNYLALTFDNRVGYIKFTDTNTRVDILMIPDNDIKENVTAYDYRISVENTSTNQAQTNIKYITENDDEYENTDTSTWTTPETVEGNANTFTLTKEVSQTNAFKFKMVWNTQSNPITFFLGSAGNEGTTGGGGADPYLYPVYSSIPLKLPNKEASYRLYENNNSDVFINASVTQATEEHQERMLQFAQSKTLKTHNIVCDGYFFDAFQIISEGNTFRINLQNKKITMNLKSENYFTIKTKKNSTYKCNAFNGYCDKVYISWTNEETGRRYRLAVNFFPNPHVENGIELLSADYKGAVGCLVRNYKPKLMELPNVSVGKYKKLHRKLKKAKSKFQMKQIKGKNEVWHYGKK